jgi:hypothetical protein
MIAPLPASVPPAKPFVYVCRRCLADGLGDRFGVLDGRRDYGHFPTWAEALTVASSIARARAAIARLREAAGR